MSPTLQRENRAHERVIKNVVICSGALYFKSNDVTITIICIMLFEVFIVTVMMSNVQNYTTQ